MRSSEQSMTGWYFLVMVMALYGIVAAYDFSFILPALNFVYGIAVKIVPIFILVFVLMGIVNYYIDPKRLVKYFGEGSRKRNWLIAAIGGIISTGPIYMWYPLLNELQKHGVRNGFIAVFLYNRAIKPPLLPFLIFYFGVSFTVILTLVMIVTSIVQGVIVEKVTGVSK